MGIIEFVKACLTPPPAGQKEAVALQLYEIGLSYAEALQPGAATHEFAADLATRLGLQLPEVQIEPDELSVEGDFITVDYNVIS
jgi:hypothetical protein